MNVHLCNPVSMEDFGNYVLEMSQDAGRKFSLEYEVLRPIGAAYPHEVAERPANCGKNRYTNILPYDFSRVKLSTVDGVEGSDYINASYIPGLHTAREYIAAQGPLPNTCADFWRMVWEQETQIIVMLTQCVERGRIKCEHYWPFDEEPVFYESTAVSMSAEEQHGDWTLRDLQLQKGTTKRSVLHFHYTAWPDHDVPSESCTRGVLEFVRCVRGKADIHAGPMVVQCRLSTYSYTYVSWSCGRNVEQRVMCIPPCTPMCWPAASAYPPINSAETSWTRTVHQNGGRFLHGRSHTCTYINKNGETLLKEQALFRIIILNVFQADFTVLNYGTLLCGAN
uniref:Protein tyrosine phosphatase receptor type O n=1 Tax=Eptatretus burgeri TaxID=7764 RepID=A0A8C4QL71_EPTBU